MTILFSPIGTADPVTELGFGPMLHIIKQKKPEKVVLFMSPKMSECENKDKRYTLSIKLLYEKIDASLPEIELIESEYEDVHHFDHYIKEFEPVLEKLTSEDENVVVNVSSGTPGMQQALVALGSFAKLNIKMFQVKTPRNSANKQGDRFDLDKFSIDAVWEYACEMEDLAGDRIIEIKTPNFKDQLLRKNIEALVNSYEYESAAMLAEQMSSASIELKETIKAAAARLNSDFQNSTKVFGGTDLKVKRNDQVVEYLYVMEVRLKQKHYAEYMRMLTPVFTSLMRLILTASNLPEHRYKASVDGVLNEKFDSKKIDNDMRLKQTLYKHHYERGDFIQNAAYFSLVQEYCNDSNVVEAVSKIRDCEYKCRNKLAHTFKTSSYDAIKKLCGITPEEIMQLLFYLHDKTQVHGDAQPGLYDRINNRIISML